LRHDGRAGGVNVSALLFYTRQARARSRNHEGADRHSGFTKDHRQVANIASQPAQVLVWVDNVSADQDRGKGLFARARSGGTDCWPDAAPGTPAAVAGAGAGAVGGADAFVRKR